MTLDGIRKSCPRDARKIAARSREGIARASMRRPSHSVQASRQRRSRRSEGEEVKPRVITLPSRSVAALIDAINRGVEDEIVDETARIALSLSEILSKPRRTQQAQKAQSK